MGDFGSVSKLKTITKRWEKNRVVKEKEYNHHCISFGIRGSHDWVFRKK